MKSVIQTSKSKCYWCQRQDIQLDNHHVFNNPYKKQSEQDGMIVYLCRDCHRELHDNYLPKDDGSGRAICNELQVKQNAQRIWESMYGTRNAFIRRYGKSYLWTEGNDR